MKKLGKLFVIILVVIGAIFSFSSMEVSANNCESNVPGTTPPWCD